MRSRQLCIILCLLALAACGEAAPDPVGRPISKVDVSKAVDKSGKPVDAATMMNRRITGTWRGTTGGHQVEATFGGDGSFSIQIGGTEGIVDAAAGTWKWRDGMLEGGSRGAVADLKRYARWSAAFVGEGAMTMNISGSDGAILTVRRG